MATSSETLPVPDLDLDYSPSRWVKRDITPDEAVHGYVRFCDEESCKFASGSGFQSELNVPYGTDERQKVDFYLPQTVEKDAPVFVYLHGGYWQAEELRRANQAYIAAPLLKTGVIVAIPGYTLAPQCEVAEMARQIEQAIILIAKRFPDTRGLCISGHSAGGHLAAMMLSVDWSQHLPRRDVIIHAIVPVSGIFDLRPITKTYVNEPLSLSESSATEVSPSLLVDAIPEANLNIKMKLIFAQYDPPAFHTQSTEYCKLLRGRGMDVETVEIPEKDHFNEITDITDGDRSILDVYLEAMR